MPKPQRFRQVHLDFHTSAQCEDIGADFDPQAFVETLKMGRVDTVNIFAKCHHGYSYYPTVVGTMHPNLKFDLLGAQIQALHSADIRCPIYVSMKWDDLAGAQHPEWVCVDKNGRAVMRAPGSGAWGWTTMDVTSGYGETFLAQIEEIAKRYQGEVDGFWLDICFPVPNYSAWGQQRLQEAGVRVDDEAAVWRYAREQDLAFFKRVTSLIRSKVPEASYYFNGTTNVEMGEVIDDVTHIEVESLPTSGGAWGYLHYPIAARQARSYGKEVIGMTGRFHKSWGDFGGLKTQDQLDYEVGTILGAGGRVCVGDQLHPRGVLDPAVYRLRGRAFARLEMLEPWLKDARPAAEVAILALGSPAPALAGIAAYSPDLEGAAQVLLEAGIQFDIVDEQADLKRYGALILPDGSALSADWQHRLREYLSQGGRLVLSGTAALDPETGAFQLEEIPAVFRGPVETVPSYIRADGLLDGENPPGDPNQIAADYDYVFYEQAYLVEAKPGAVTHGQIRRALFNRTWEHFTSHAHAPVEVGDGSDQINISPAAVQNVSVLYFAAPLFGAYRKHDYWAYRVMAVNALRGFLPPALLIPVGPCWVEFSLTIQPAAADHPARSVVHVTAYHPRRSLQTVPHADQCWPTSGLGFKLRIDTAPQRVYLAPEGTDLPYRLEDGYLRVGLPPVGAHAVVVIEY